MALYPPTWGYPSPIKVSLLRDAVWQGRMPKLVSLMEHREKAMLTLAEGFGLEKDPGSSGISCVQREQRKPTWRGADGTP